MIYLGNISTKQLTCEGYVWTCVGNVGNIPCNVGFVDIKIGDIRMEYMVNVVVIVKASSEKEARHYVEQHLKGPYTSSINVVSIEALES
jgi:hypothetical protein